MGAHVFDADGVHSVDMNRCVMCMECVTYCPTGALECKSRAYTPQELFEIVAADKDYYESSGGGVTVSGGEPMLSVDFLEEFLPKLKAQGIHVALDTAGVIAEKQYEKIDKWVDLYLYDLKGFNDENHIKYVGSSNKQVLSNLKWLSDNGAKIMCRIPLMKGINDSLEDAREYAALLSTLKGIVSVKLLPYHNYGINKAASIGREMIEFEQPDNINQITEIYLQYNIELEA